MASSAVMSGQRAFLLNHQPPALRLLWVSAVLLALLVITMLVAIGSGSSQIAYGDVAQILLHPLGVPINPTIPESQITIVHQVRLPRILTAMLVGAALASAGAVMQGIFRNPLADPGILGVSAGGSFGAVMAFATGMALGGLWVVPIFSFVGGMISAVIVYALSLERGRTNVMSLLLAGIALNAFLSALISVLVLMTDDYTETLTILQWLIGGLSGRGWRHIYIIFVPILLTLVLIYRYSRDLNLFLLGEETAQGLGTNVPRTRLILLATSALLTSVAVSMVGPIGFVGLVVPHILRLIIGPDYRVLLPASALGGAVFLILTDTIARLFILNQEMPVGVVTGVLGGPFFLYLLWRYRVSSRRGGFL
jgi:iron complex transport system permease protein